MDESLLEALFHQLEFLDDQTDLELDLRGIVREQEIMTARVEDLSDERKQDYVDGFTALAAESGEREQEIIEDLLVGFDLIDDPEDEED